MSNFRPIGRMTGFLLPSSMDEWLPGRHLARFVLEVIAKLDLSRMTCTYRESRIMRVAGGGFEQSCNAQAVAARKGKRLYAPRKQIPKPVFGIIKSTMGFRQFPLRGLHKVKGEWNLVTLAWKVRRMFILGPA